jgi:hypothetical protein
MDDIKREYTYAEAMLRLTNRYNGVQRRAAKRNLEFSITLTDLAELLSKPCIYCGAAKSGIDRKDNSKGYVVDNCVPACQRCNTIKGNLYDFEEMMELGHEIKEYEAYDD